MHELMEDERWAIYRVGVYAAWADGRLAPDQLSAVRALAEELQLADLGRDPDAELRRGAPVGLELDRPFARWSTRRLAYAVAAWVALCDGRLHRAEQAVLRMLRRRLGLPLAVAELIETSVALVLAPGPDTPPRLRVRAIMHALD